MLLRVQLLVVVIASHLLIEVDGAAVAQGLLDPDSQPFFDEPVPNALDPGFVIQPFPRGILGLGVYETVHETGLVDPNSKWRLNTTVWGYGVSSAKASWPGPTLEVQKNVTLKVIWENMLYGVKRHPFTSLGTSLPDGLTVPAGLSVVDTNVHWAYSVIHPDPSTNRTEYTIEEDGVPIVVHLHGGSSFPPMDGNPEYFFTPGWQLKGPQWAKKTYVYSNSQPAGTLWYHDHTLGITRLNVYAGLAGFYFIRDRYDTGVVGNPLNLPAGPYELAYAIQDRMFKTSGELFYPAYPGEPYYDEFILDTGAVLPSSNPGDPFYPYRGPTALAEFFGDFMVVNGKAWPKVNVEPRKYRLRLLNGCDSRFLVIQFEKTKLASPKTTAERLGDNPPNPEDRAGVIPFMVIGADQGLLRKPIGGVKSSVLEPGARLDVIIDFNGLDGKRVIMTNYGGDQPFGGTIPGPQLYSKTGKIMAFDVTKPMTGVEVRPLQRFPRKGRLRTPVRTRRIGLFEGRDEFGRLQPLLGGDANGDDNLETLTWNDPTTETPSVGTIEEWEIYNFSGDAHPVHLHLVDFEVIGRNMIVYDSNADDEGFVLGAPAGDGVYLEPKDQMQHNGSMGAGLKATFPQGYTNGVIVSAGSQYSAEYAGPRDVVTALPGQVTIIRAKFDKPGEFVWHCHILSHEDHEMMRRYEVVL